MATKVKPSRLQVSWTPQVWQVPVYVDEDTFSWWAWWGGGTWDVSWPASSTDWDIVLFDWATWKIIKDSWVWLSSKLDASALSNNNYWWAWEGDSTHTPTKWVLYDKIHTMDVEIWNKAADTAVVKITWNQTINWTKTFGTSPVVPSKTSDATNTGTAVATEAQVYKKQDTLVNQTNIKSVNWNNLLWSWNIVLFSAIQVTLAAASWSSEEITVTATWVTASNHVIVSPDPSSITDYADALVYCSNQASNSLTFKCTTAPENDITVNVLIIN